MVCFSKCAYVCVFLYMTMCQCVVEFPSLKSTNLLFFRFSGQVLQCEDYFWVKVRLRSGSGLSLSWIYMFICIQQTRSPRDSRLSGNCRLWCESERDELYHIILLFYLLWWYSTLLHDECIYSFTNSHIFCSEGHPVSVSVSVRPGIQWFRAYKLSHWYFPSLKSDKYVHVMSD